MDTQLEKHRIVRRDEVSQTDRSGPGDDLQEGIRWQFPRAHPPWSPIRGLATVGCSRLAAGTGEAMGPV